MKNVTGRGSFENNLPKLKNFDLVADQ